MSSGIKITDDYLFYIEDKDNYLYRINLDNNSTIEIGNNIMNIAVYKEKIYYLKWEEWGKRCFYEANLEGKNKKLLEHFYSDSIVTHLEYRDEVLYYYTKRHENNAPEIENKIML